MIKKQILFLCCFKRAMLSVLAACLVMSAPVQAQNSDTSLLPVTSSVSINGEASSSSTTTAAEQAMLAEQVGEQSESIQSDEKLADGVPGALVDNELLDSEVAGEAAELSTLPHNLSPQGMFMAADWVVKSVMIILALASLLTWTVLVSKTVELASLKLSLRKSRVTISSSRTLANAANADRMAKVGRALIDAAETELQLSADILNKEQSTADIKEGVKERVASSLSRVEAASTRRMMIGTGVLASIGAIAPFVGLFGTVWGIMNSFIGISEAKTTNLAVVAPGIAEALLATALGLVAAIPAVIIYNYFTRQISGARSMVSDISANVMRLVSRDLDRGVLLMVVKSNMASVKTAVKAAE